MSVGAHQPGLFPACALFANPKQASAMPARPTPNCFSAARRVTDWAKLLVSSSNWLFIFFLSFWLVVISGFFPHGPNQFPRARRFVFETDLFPFEAHSR